MPGQSGSVGHLSSYICNEHTVYDITDIKEDRLAYEFKMLSYVKYFYGYVKRIISYLYVIFRMKRTGLSLCGTLHVCRSESDLR